MGSEPGQLLDMKNDMTRCMYGVRGPIMIIASEV